jgi:HEAT repeat protein
MKTCFLLIALLFLCPQAFGEESLEDLIKILRHDSAEKRMEAAHAIGCKGEEAKKAVSALKSRLRDDDVMVQIFAVNALARIGPSASSAVSSLRIALRHPHACVREAAAWALGSIGPEAKSASETHAPQGQVPGGQAMGGLGADQNPSKAQAQHPCERPGAQTR